jgi:phytoene dehydrogenase-like protein
MAAGVDCVVLEASDRVGGRVRTDRVDGFQLDHGFQVLLTAYPACQQWLDYETLRLRPFATGAQIRCGDRFAVLADPWRAPAQLLRTAAAPVGSLADKWRIGKLRRATRRGSLADLYRRPPKPTLDYLRALGFGESFIDQFLRPFLGGVFLERDLQTSSRMLEFVFRMFAAGPITLPADGMAAIPRQLADRLPRGSLQLQRTVQRWEPQRLTLSDGSSLGAKQTVIATEANAAARLLGDAAGAARLQLDQRPWHGTVCIYFAAPRQPPVGSYLTLCGDDDQGPINHLAVLSAAAPEYAPPGRSLVSVTLRDGSLAADPSRLDDALLEQTRQQLRRWFGAEVDDWQWLRSYAVPCALPSQGVKDLEPVVRTVEPLGSSGPVICGDHRETSSIQGAMNSGTRAAEAICRRLGV